MEDRSTAFYDTSEQPAIASVAGWNTRRWITFGLCVLCLAAFTALLLMYALLSLPEWLSLLVGLLIVLLFAGMLIALGVATHAPSDWE